MRNSSQDLYEKGKAFEGFVEMMFLPREFDVLQRADPEGSKLPDLYIKDKKTREKFWVEAKWRNRLYNDKFKICDPTRLKSYAAFQESVRPETLFLVLGLGGAPSSPDELFCIPFADIEYPELYRSKLLPKKHDHAAFRYERGRLY